MFEFWFIVDTIASLLTVIFLGVLVWWHKPVSGHFPWYEDPTHEVRIKRMELLIDRLEAENRGGAG